MSIFVVSITILFITLIGYCFIQACEVFDKKDKLLAVAYGYGLGIGLVAFQLYVYARVHIPWNMTSLLFPWILFILMRFFSFGKLRIRITTFKRIGFISLLLFIGIGITVVYTLFEALLRPVTVWDGWAIWLLKAKVFFIDGTIRPETLAYVGSEYPLVISLFGTFIYIMLGGVNDTVVLLTSFAFYVFLSLAFFASIQKNIGTTYALFFTFLLMTIQNFVRHGGRLESGQADLPLGYFIFVSTMLFLEYYKTKSWKLLLLLSIFLGITGSIKNEGIFFTIIIGVFVFFAIVKNKAYNHLFFILLWILPLIDWYVYKTSHHLSAIVPRTFGFSLQNAMSVLASIVKEFLSIKTWSLVWICYFYLLFFWPAKLGRNLLCINVIIFSQLGFYVLIYLFIAEYGPESSLERLLMHIAPLVIYFIAVRGKQILFS